MRPKDQLDPSVIFTPKQDGDYILGITDSRGLGGASFVYRVEFEPVSDGYYTYVSSTAHDAFEINRATGFIVPQGNQWTLNVSLGEMQGNRYKGEIDLEAVGLPPGVRMIAPRVMPGMRQVPVQFVADAATPPCTALFEIFARAVDPNIKLTSGCQQSVSFINHSGGRAWNFLLLRKFALAVTRPAPFHLELAQPGIALSQSGELSLNVKLIRHGDFHEPVDILPDWLPFGVGSQSTVTIEPDQTDVKLSLNADPQARPGVYKFAMNGTTTGGLFYSGVGRIRVSSPFIELTVGEPNVAANIHRAAIERGQKGEIVCDLKHLKPFAGQATATLKRLPKGVIVLPPLPQITSGQSQVTFQVEATPDALVGQYTGVVCEVTLEENGQSIHQQTGSGILRIDPARGSAAAK